MCGLARKGSPFLKNQGSRGNSEGDYYTFVLDHRRCSLGSALPGRLEAWVMILRKRNLARAIGRRCITGRMASKSGSSRANWANGQLRDFGFVACTEKSSLDTRLKSVFSETKKIVNRKRLISNRHLRECPSRQHIYSAKVKRTVCSVGQLSCECIYLIPAPGCIHFSHGLNWARHGQDGARTQ